MRIGFLKYLVFVPALTLVASGRELRLRLGPATPVQAIRVPLDAADPARTRLGALTYLGGVRLRNGDPAFGGFSSMEVRGDRFTLLSDAGNIVRFRMGPDWTPRDVRFGDLPAGTGSPAYKRNRDSESLAADPATGRYWVGFERSNAIWRYDAGFTRGEASAQPAMMRDWSENGGAESMVRLRDGRFLVISETTRPENGRRRAERVVALFSGDPTDPAVRVQELSYVPPAQYDPSDAAELPDGRLLVLNRRITLRDLFTAKLTLVDIRGAKPGAVLRGTEIATFAAPVQHDNFECLAITRESGATILWIASDDNQQWWEQSLLLKFRLEL